MKAADLQRRIVATVIDRVIFLPALFAAAKMPMPLLTWVLVTSIYPIYRLYCHAAFGKTLGKRLMGIQVVRFDNRVLIGPLEAIRRSCVEIVPELLTVSAVLASAEDETQQLVRSIASGWMFGCSLTVLFQRDNRAPHDLFANSIVVEVSPSLPPMM